MNFQHVNSAGRGPPSQILRRDLGGQGFRLASPKDFGHRDKIGILQAGGEFVQQSEGARGLVGLENAP
jgi:hypothetical protein